MTAEVATWPDTWTVCLPPFPGRERQRKGECAAHAVVTAMECWVLRQRPDLYDQFPLSETDLYRMESTHSVPAALRAVTRYGVLDHPALSDPSRAKMSKAQREKAIERFWGLRYEQIKASASERHEAMIRTLEDGFPIVTNVYVGANFEADPQDTPYSIKLPRLGEAHAICIVGYDAKNRHWIAKNSYGDSWGVSGCFAFAMGDPLMDAESQMYAVREVYLPTNS